MSRRYTHECEGCHHPVCSVRQQDRPADALHMVGSVWEVYPSGSSSRYGGQVDKGEVMKIKALELTPKDATDIVIGAIEGGTGYWAECKDYRWKNWYIAPDAKYGEENYNKLRDIPRFEVLVRIKEDKDQVDPQREPNDWFEITIANLEVGTALALERYPHLFNGIGGSEGDVEFDLDATGCDVIFQMTVFGEVVYG